MMVFMLIICCIASFATGFSFGIFIKVAVEEERLRAQKEGK